MKQLIIISVIASSFSLHALEWRYSRAIDKGKKEQWSDAGRDLRSLLVDHPDNPELLYDNGVARFKEKQFSQATAYFEQAATYNPPQELLEQIHFNLGNSCVELEKLPQAVEQYEKVLALNPDNESARHNRDIVRQMIEEEKKQQEQQEQQKQQQPPNSPQKQDQSQNQQNQSGNDQSPNQSNEQQDQQNQDNPQSGERNATNQPQSGEQQNSEQPSERHPESQKQRNNPQQHGNEQQRKDKGEREQRSHDERGNERHHKEHAEKELAKKEHGNNAHNDQQAHNNPHQAKEQQGQHKKDTATGQENMATAQSDDQDPYFDKNNPRDQQLAYLLGQCEDADEKANKRFMKALMRKEGKDHESQPGW